MSFALICHFVYQGYPSIKLHLNGSNTLWAQLLSVTTFTLTFFVNQSYSLWRTCQQQSRRLQGRLLDIGLNCATHAARKTPLSLNEPSGYTAASRQTLELMSRYIRLFNLLTYASFTRSHRPILTPRGMRRLVERGLMTQQERQVLVDAAIPATQRHSTILMWMIRLFIEARAAGHILGGDGFENQTLERFHIIRAQYGGIGDELAGRMPLAYAHLVQVLVDLILWTYPIMAFSTGMSPFLVVLGTGLLTISYQGLFDLAKQFLDPYDNENYGKGEDPLCVDTLIAETNAGSTRWMYGFEEMPYSAQRIKEGELYHYLLPVRGYSVEEVAQMEKDRIQEQEQNQSQREEEERRQKLLEEEEARLQRMLEEEEAKQQREEKEKRQKLMEEDEARMMEEEEEAKQLLINQKSDAIDIPMELVDAGLTTPEKSVHKVTTIAGTPVTFDPDVNKTVVEETRVETKVAAPTANYLASLKANAPKAPVPVIIEQMESPELTFEEFSQQIAKIQEVAKDEMLETVEILNAQPGPEDTKKV
jgi:hypothetical protein